ncbi:MAG: hypothetical protein HRU38_07790 [Saccharospirillaceae bacterium]|nr:hypothetical protein [Pseudomonadales bacterium]NRB78555.1 hypothetical protein [Saccharospirillaceae bacterium]
MNSVIRSLLLLCSLSIVCAQLNAQKAPLLEIRKEFSIFENILTSGQPTRTDFELAAQNGFKTVINLRSRGEIGSWNERKKIEALGMRYVSIPISGLDDFNINVLNEINEVVFETVFEAKGFVLIHDSNANRIGALMALEAFFNHDMSVEEAVSLGKKSGMTTLEDYIRTLLFDSKSDYESDDELDGFDDLFM